MVRGMAPAQTGMNYKQIATVILVALIMWAAIIGLAFLLAYL
jgi:hypothetical protein